MPVTDDGEVVSQGEVERSILRLSDRLETMTSELITYAEAAKRAEVNWKRTAAATRIPRRVSGGHGPGGRATEQEIEDHVMVKHADLYEAYKIAEGVYESHRDAMFSVRAQMDALRTIAANIRSQT